MNKVILSLPELAEDYGVPVYVIQLAVGVREFQHTYVLEANTLTALLKASHTMFDNIERAVNGYLAMCDYS